jgi:hypothetical protein
MRGWIFSLLLLAIFFGTGLIASEVTNCETVQPFLWRSFPLLQNVRVIEIEVDSDGNIYVAGGIKTPDEGDVFFAKLDPKGAVLYSVAVGGSATEAATELAIDGQGNVYLTGVTQSNDFPNRKSFQPVKINQQDAFVVKLDSQGSIVFSTYLGGSSLERTSGIAADAEGNVYVTGATRSGDFPLVRPFQAQKKGEEGGFLTKFDPAGSPVYSTFLGGDCIDDFPAAVGADSEGNAFVTGATCTGKFARGDAFVAKFDPAGGRLVYSTFGGSTEDRPIDLTIGPGNNVFVIGETDSTDFPVRRASQPENAGNQDVFITKLNPDASTILYSTYFGSRGGDVADRIVVDRKGRAFVLANVNRLPVVNPIPGQTIGGQHLILLSHGGSKLLFSTPFSDSRIFGIATNSGSKFYLAGAPEMQDFPATVTIIKNKPIAALARFHDK